MNQERGIKMTAAGRMVMGLAAAAALAAVSYKLLKDQKKEKRRMRIKKSVEPQRAHKEWRRRHSAIGRVSESSEFVGEIPSDLWPDILSRLPAKSIARFRCVCKQWRSSTYSAAFQELHCKRALDRKPHTIFVPEYGVGGLPVYELGPADGQITEYSPPLVLKLGFNHRISNPVNGLVVAYLLRGSQLNYWLVNPATREQSSLPAGKRHPGTIGCHVGLGFDSSSAKYKLVRLLWRDNPYYYSCEILTVGTLEWRSIGETPCAVELGHSAFLNGAIYWLVLNSESMSVLVFDIKVEKFQMISSSVPSVQYVNLFSLHQFGGQIFVAESPRLPHRSPLRIWRLKDDGGSHEWKEECNVNLSSYSNEIGSLPIHFLDIKDGKLMIQQSPSIYSYDLQSKALQEIYPLSGFYEVGPLYPMAESFISPKSLTDTSTL